MTSAADACLRTLDHLYRQEYELRQLLGEDPICTRVAVGDWREASGLDEFTFWRTVRSLERTRRFRRDQGGARPLIVFHRIADWCAHERPCVAVGGHLDCNCRVL